MPTAKLKYSEYASLTDGGLTADISLGRGDGHVYGVCAGKRGRPDAKGGVRERFGRLQEVCGGSVFGKGGGTKPADVRLQDRL